MSTNNDGTPPDIDEILASIGSEESTPGSTADSGAGDSNESENSDENQNRSENSDVEVIETQEMTVEDLVGHDKSLADSIFQDISADSIVADDTKAKADAKKAADEKADKEKADKEAADKAAAAAAAEAGKPDDESGKKDEKVEDPHAAALEKEVPGGAHAKESTRTDWEALRTAAKAYKQEAETKKAELEAVAAEKAALEERVKTGAGEVPEEVKQELETLRQRAIEFDVTLLPEVREYDKKIDGASAAVLHWFNEAGKDPNRIYDVLDAEGKPTGKKSGLTPENLEALKSSVGKVGFTKYNWSKWINQCLENEIITGIEARQLETTIGNAMNLEQNKRSEIQRQVESFAVRKAAGEIAAQQAAEDHHKAAMEVVNQTKGLLAQTKEKYDWAKDPGELPANATAEQKTAHEEKVKTFNQRAGTFQKLLKTYWGARGIKFDGADKIPDMTVDEFGDLFVRAFSVDDVKKEKAAVEAKLAETIRELDEYRAGGSTAPKSGARAGGAEAPKAVAKVDFDFTPESVLASIK